MSRFSTSENDSDLIVNTLKGRLGNLLFEREWRQENRPNYGRSPSDRTMEEDISILENTIAAIEKI